MKIASTQAQFTDLQDPIISSDTPPKNIPDSSVLWLDTSVDPNVLKKWNGNAWVVVNDTAGLKQTMETLQTDFKVEQGKVSTLIKNTTIENKDGSESTLKDKYLETVQTVDGINTTVKNVQTDVSGLSAKVAEIKITADGVSSTVTNNKTKWDQAATDATQALTDSNQAQQDASQAKQDAENVKENIKKTVKNIEIQFSLSDSDTEYIQYTEWSGVPPLPVDGKFLWQRTKTSYVDPMIKPEYSNIACIAGKNGKDGQDGSNGKDGQDAILLNIHSSNGMTFKNTCISTVLTVEIIYGNQVITTHEQMIKVFGDASKLVWECKRPNEPNWSIISDTDKRLKDGGFMFTLSTNDIFQHMIFNCGLDY